MSTGSLYLTTAIPYVNAEPHLGHVLEFVQADVLARHARLRGRPVRFLSGTDDHAGKNVTAAESAGVPVREFVNANASRFAALREPLGLSYDDFIRTSADPRHSPGVHRLWRRGAARGDYYRRRYTGLYCTGCEQFRATDELVDGVCPEHGVPPEEVSEQNWFFRLSRYTGPLLDAIETGELRIKPATKRNEILGFLRSGLTDISVSRPVTRAGGWGIPVPDDPDQVIYVWWDALANYVTALDFAVDGRAYHDWWLHGDERVHVIGKGIVRFHAVYWAALLLSAGQPLPTSIYIHDYLTVEGAKISKSTGNTADPVEICDRAGTDALRWWLLSEVPRVGDADFTEARLLARYDRDLAGGLGNLVNRTVALVHKFRRGVIDADAPPLERVDLTTVAARLPEDIDRGLDEFDFRAATNALRSVVDAGNRVVEAERPWELARNEAAGSQTAGIQLNAVLTSLVLACRTVADELTPFLPHGSARLREQLGTGPEVGEPEPAFPRSSHDHQRSPVP